MAVNLPRAGSPMVYNYHYDQLNRIAQMDAFTATGIAFGGLTNNGDYGEKASYDANGNIQAYKRNGSSAAGGQSMDDLTYHYYTGSANKLEYITDAVGAQAYTGDVDNMQPGNYQYDAIGNIIADASAGITHISWTVYGKIQAIQKADGTTLITPTMPPATASARPSPVAEIQLPPGMYAMPRAMCWMYTAHCPVNNGH